MAMKARGSGVWPVYEDFKPTSEWHQDALSHNLIVSLPGFIKEQLRVSTEGGNTIRVRGERLIDGNKWSRFLEDFEVPQNSDMNSIRAKFHEGALTITMPKKMVDKPKPHQSIPEKELSKGLETPNTSSHPNEKQKHGQADVRSATPFKDAQDAERKEARMSKEEHSKVDEKEGTLKKMDIKEEKKSERSEDLDEDQTYMKKKLKTDDGAAATNEPREKSKQGKPKQPTEPSGAGHGAFTKKTVKGFAHLSEERQLMVNMGAAVLVIVAFSAYVTYKFVSADDNK